MEARKIRVAITHGDTNSIGYELIFKTFSEPEMLDMCVPIVYGSPKVAAYHKKVMNTPAQFTIIHKAEDAMEGRLNLLAAIEDEVKVELGTATPESGGAEVAPPAPCREHPASRAAARRTGGPDLQMLRMAYPSSGSVTGT